MRSDDESKSRQLADVTYTRLLKRWNMPQARAVIWFLGGLGYLTDNDFVGSKFMAYNVCAQDGQCRPVMEYAIKYENDDGGTFQGASCRYSVIVTTSPPCG
jgi:hypothetical protein